MISVYIPSQLTAYSGAATRVPAKCLAVGEVLDDLDRWFPGLKFRVVDEQDRVRRHMRIFVGCDETHYMARLLAPGNEVLIFGALCGG